MGDDVTDPDDPDASEAPKTYSEIFHETFPHYLMMGMSPEEYWEGDSSLVKDYRKAYKLQVEQRYREQDEMAWLQGKYMRDALQSVYLLVNGFVPKGTQAHPYPEKPESIRAEEEKAEKKRQKKREERKQKEEEQTRSAMAFFQAAVAKFNKNFEKRKKQKEAEEAEKAKAEKNADSAEK